MIIVLKRKQIAIFACATLFGVLLITAIILYVKSNHKLQAVNKPGNPYTVYLTFDDGPSINTEKALDVLKSYGVKATFFVVGYSEDYETTLYKRIITEGHSLGIHSYTHNTNRIYNSSTEFIQDFEQLRDLIIETTGTSPKVCRMVGGSNSKYCPKNIRLQIVDYFNDNEYTCYDWDIDPLDSGSYALAANTIAENIIKAAKKKPNQDLVILLHDDKIRKTLPDSLELTIPYFKEQGYVFEALDPDTTLNNSRALVKN